MGILRGPGEAGHLLGRRDLLQLGAEVLPTRAERLPGTAEQRVGQLGCAEAGEARQHLLLLCRRVAVLARDGLRQADCPDVVGRPRLPAMGQGAVAREPPVTRGHARRRRGGRRIVGIVVLGLAEAQPTGHGAVKGEAAAGQGGAVEQGQRELGGRRVWHCAGSCRASAESPAAGEAVGVAVRMGGSGRRIGPVRGQRSGGQGVRVSPRRRYRSKLRPSRADRCATSLGSRAVSGAT